MALLTQQMPTNSYLHHIGLSIDPSFPVCHKSPETIEHTFLNCFVVRNFLLDLGLNIHYIMNTPTHWLRNIYDMDVSLSDTNLHWKDFFPFTLWHIWIHRNQQVFRPNLFAQDYISPSEISMWAKEFNLMTDSSPLIPAKQNSSVRWLPQLQMFLNWILMVHSSKVLTQVASVGFLGIPLAIGLLAFVKKSMLIDMWWMKWKLSILG